MLYRSAIHKRNLHSAYHPLLVTFPISLLPRQSHSHFGLGLCLGHHHSPVVCNARFCFSIILTYPDMLCMCVCVFVSVDSVGSVVQLARVMAVEGVTWWRVVVVECTATSLLYNVLECVNTETLFGQGGYHWGSNRPRALIREGDGRLPILTRESQLLLHHEQNCIFRIAPAPLVALLTTPQSLPGLGG